MRTIAVATATLTCLLTSGFSPAQADKGEEMTPPLAKIEPKNFEEHGHVRVDNYYWLRERENPAVIDYLQAENRYTEAMLDHTKPLQERIFEEIKGRIKQTDDTVPYLKNGYYYYSRTEDGRPYSIYCRKSGALDAPEEVMLDVNTVADGHEHCRVRSVEVSPSSKILAYAVDFVGRRLYALRFVDLDTGTLLEDHIPDVTANIAWANDNKTVFYTKQDPVTLRWHEIYRHVLGTDPTEDVLVYEEKDEEFSCYLTKTKSDEYILVVSDQTLSSEVRFLPADEPEGELVVFLAREENHEYSLEHLGDKFYIRTNWNAKNFRLMSAPAASSSKDVWEEIIPTRDDVFLEGFDVFERFLVVEERKNGLIQLRIHPWSGEQQDHYIDFGEPAYLAYASDNHEVKTDKLRYVYTSMTTPESTFDYDMGMRRQELLKQDEILGDFDQRNYKTERLYAPAGDGQSVPISIVYRRGLVRDGNNPLLLYGYGSYGYSLDASFNASRLSLLDRGFVYAIAHIRGGQELGRQWYENGKLLKKRNTFTDFIDCARYLVDEGYTNPSLLLGQGGSAGGLLVGAVMNMAPGLFHGFVTRVPFVDVVTTMLDESIPLTTSEYDEWGNPSDEEYYDYMMSYSPYDNVEAKDYPNLLVTTGLHDSQVQYWEPAKWVAKLRAMKTDNNILLLKTNMEAGHSGASGRYDRYRETALNYAFMLDIIGYEYHAHRGE